MTEPQTTPAPAKKSALGWWAAAVVAVVVVIAVAAQGSSGGAHNGGALQACEGFVTNQLISPGSASFSGESLSNTGSTYVLTGSVDSDNSFGALIRNNFTCTTTDDNGNFTLVSMDGLTN